MTPQETVSLAKISQYLWNEKIPKEQYFFNGTIDPRKARQLYMIRTALQYGIAQNLLGQAGMSNYLYALCGAELQRAKQILGTGQGGGSVIPGGGGNFSVYEYTTHAITGAFTVYFPSAVNKRLVNAFRQGNNIGTILTAGTPSGNQVVWDSAAGSLTVASTVPFYNQEFVRVVVQQ
jgi:hypothetical protein